VIAVFVNPSARANRRDPRLAAKFQAILGGDGQVLAPRSLDELDQAAAGLRASSPSLIAIHGGDGTLHKTLSALINGWAGAPLPPVAILCGGTMNVVASSLGLRERPEVMLTQLVEAQRAGRPLVTLRKRCVQVGDRYGFIFGNGLLANFLTEYYGPNGYGPMRAIWILLRCFASAVVVGQFSRRLFRRFEGRVLVDGQPLSWPRFVSVGAATVREVGLGFKLYNRADDDPDRFGVLAIHAGPLALLPDMPAVHAGRGIPPERAYATTATTLDVSSEAPQMTYTIDGDLYHTSAPIHVAVGPAIEFIKPERRRLLAPAASDTMIKLP
jgi:diacylglycerol kinase family enzyme